MASSRYILRISAILPLICITALCGYLLVNPSSVSSAHAPEARIVGKVSVKGMTGPVPKTYIQVFKRGTLLKVTETKPVTGEYKISGIDPGVYDLKATPEVPYRERKLDGHKVEEGDNPLDIEVEHSVASRLGGTTRSESGEVQAGTEVCVFAAECDECNLGCTASGKDGAYAFEVAPARYLVGIRVKNAAGVETVSFATREINVLPNEPYTFNLKTIWRGPELTVRGTTPDYVRVIGGTFAALTTAGKSISGKFLFNDKPVPGVTVTVTGPAGIPETKITDNDGAYIFLNLAPGAYTLTATPPTSFAGFPPAKVHVSLAEPAAVFVHLTPAGSGQLAQVIVNDVTNDLPIASSRIYNLALSAPGVSQLGTFSGGRPYQSNITLDGIDVNNSTDLSINSTRMAVAAFQEFAVVSQRFSAEYPRSVGGIQNIITASGGNDVHGDVFGYGTTKGLVRELKNFPFTGAAFNDHSNVDIGGQIGGRIVKSKLFYFGAFNPQRRTNHYLTQSIHRPVSNQTTVPFYAGKIDWVINQNHHITISTFGDLTRTRGFLATSELNNVNGFGDNPAAFEGRLETGGHSYDFRLNSTFTSNFTGEFSGRLSFQRQNTIPLDFNQSRITDNFAVLKGDNVLAPVQSGVNFGSGTGFIDYVDGRGGTLQRNFVRGTGFGIFSNQNRDYHDLAARLVAVKGQHTVRWGFEWSQNRYDTDMRSTGPSVTYGFTPGGVNPDGTPLRNTNGNSNATNGSLITNNWLVCAVRATVINCPDAASVERVQGIPNAQLAALGLSVNPVPGAITAGEAFNSPFLIRNTTRVRDFQIVGKTHTNLESFYVVDDVKVTPIFTLNLGLRWDYQQGYANNRTSLKLNNFFDNAAPRLGFAWDFTRNGRGKLYGNYAKFIQVPLSWELSVRAAAGAIHSEKHFNVDRLNAPAGSLIVPGVSTGATDLGAGGAPPDRGLKPQSTREFTLGVEYEVGRNFIIGSRGIYQSMIDVIEDASFNDGDTYFIFNPGRVEPGTTEQAACAGDPVAGLAPRCFGRAQRFYRALEFTAAKRWSHHYFFNASYVFSSLIGNYSGLLPIDYWQSDPNFISLFDSRSVLENTYGRLPYDRPHSFKFNGSYETPFKLTMSGTFSAQSGVPFNALIPHPTYGDNEGFLAPRGTAIVPAVSPVEPGFPNVVNSIGTRRTPAIIKLDLNLTQRFMLGESKDLYLSAAWFNVFNSQRATSVDQTFQINSGVAGVPNVANPFFGSALLSQTPSSFRFGVRFRF